MARQPHAIHLATARAIAEDLSGLVSYDDRLAVAADDADIKALSPKW